MRLAISGLDDTVPYWPGIRTTEQAELIKPSPNDTTLATGYSVLYQLRLATDIKRLSRCRYVWNKTRLTTFAQDPDPSKKAKTKGKTGAVPETLQPLRLGIRNKDKQRMPSLFGDGDDGGSTFDPTSDDPSRNSGDCVVFLSAGNLSFDYRRVELRW